MKKFEYTVKYIAYSTPDPKNEQIIKDLNDLGEQGWEIYLVDRKKNIFHFYGKREKK